VIAANVIAGAGRTDWRYRPTSTSDGSMQRRNESAPVVPVRRRGAKPHLELIRAHLAPDRARSDLHRGSHFAGDEEDEA
jgi:hypothetical protein